MAKGRQVALRVPNDQLEAINADFRRQGLVEWTLRSRNGERSLVGRTKAGITLRVTQYDQNGFRERTASTCERLTAAKRKVEAKRLRRHGLTQAAIAERLGWSQKTISNDLSS